MNFRLFCFQLHQHRLKALCTEECVHCAASSIHILLPVSNVMSSPVDDMPCYIMNDPKTTPGDSIATPSETFTYFGPKGTELDPSRIFSSSFQALD